MIQRLYSVYDLKVHQFGIPFVAHDDYDAQRCAAATLITVPVNHLMFACPGDYELYYLGDLDGEGHFVQSEADPKPIIFFADLIRIFKVDKLREEYFSNVQISNELPKDPVQ